MTDQELTQPVQGPISTDALPWRDRVPAASPRVCDMLEGAATLRLGEQRHPLKAGDYVCFPAGQRAGHCLINEGNQPCRYLVIGERNPHEVAVYTDSNKIMVRGLREIYDKSARKQYWDGEE